MGLDARWYSGIVEQILGSAQNQIVGAPFVVRITYVESNGTEHLVEAKRGQSVMEAAVKSGVPGISAECGGSCTCATCRVYIVENWRPKTGEPQDIERDMLEFSDESKHGVRLSCQIRVTEELDGLVVRIPDHQG